VILRGIHGRGKALLHGRERLGNSGGEFADNLAFYTDVLGFKKSKGI